MNIDRQKYVEIIGGIKGWYNPDDFFVSSQLLSQVIDKRCASNEKVNFLEIGVFQGKSLVPMCKYFYSKIDRFYACDIWSHNIQIEMLRNHLERFVTKDYMEKVVFIQEDSRNLDQLFSGELDNERFLYCSIDGDHSYNSTYSDLCFCADRLLPGGIIVLDDVFHVLDAEVSNALYDFLEVYPHLKVIQTIRNRTVISEDLEIMDAVFDPQTMERQKMKNQWINIMKPESGFI